MVIRPQSDEIYIVLLVLSDTDGMFIMKVGPVDLNFWAFSQICFDFLTEITLRHRYNETIQGLLGGWLYTLNPHDMLG